MCIMTLQQISSAVYNSVVGGLTGITSNPKISIEQLEDEVSTASIFMFKTPQ